MKQELEKLILKYKKLLDTGNAFLKTPYMKKDAYLLQRQLNAIWRQILKDLKDLADK